jgi:BMFP domain-containing protein YqiC
MVTAPNRIFDDIARLMTDAAGAAQGMRREVETVIKSQLEKLMRDLDVVAREDFEAVREMALIAREENDRLAARLTALEARLAGTDATAPAAPKVAAKSAAGKAAGGKAPAAKKAAGSKPTRAKAAKPKA